MARSRSSTPSRLSVDDWIQTGFALLAEEGIEADLRAMATFAAGVGFLHLAGPTPPTGEGDRRDRFLELMLRR